MNSALYYPLSREGIYFWTIVALSILLAPTLSIIFAGGSIYVTIILFVIFLVGAVIVLDWSRDDVEYLDEPVTREGPPVPLDQINREKFSQMKPSVCVQCNATIDPDSDFCPECGYKIVK
ncbi:MAG: zinc-ribbon domain-containing protein [Candidatus Kariarchaeaceae archaeon]|jgi:ribosomal protein L40E